MDKPSWDDAPDGANWLTGDYLGYAFWQHEPVRADWGIYGSIWHTPCGGGMWNVASSDRSTVFKERKP